MNEFDLISKYFSDVGVSDESVVVGIGDDAAIISPPAGKRLVLSVDSLLEGVHFLASTAPEHIASRAFGSAFSDLAAMGAQASHFTLTISLPESNAEWLARFSAKLADLSRHYRVKLVGGDTTRGPLAVTLQVHGWAEAGSTLLRSDAKQGDHVFVTGTLGDAAGGLICARDLSPIGLSTENEQYGSLAFLLSRFNEPTPRLEAGALLAKFASAAIDISDGLLADAKHLVNASGVGLEIDCQSLPISKSLQAVFPDRSMQLSLSGGDDYELLFTVPECNLHYLKELDFGCEISQIGQVNDSESVNLIGLSDEVLAQLNVHSKGYLHFD